MPDIMFQPNEMLNRIADFAGELKLASLQPQIVACRNQLEAHNGIDVAVFGRFKAGKSSFLNHLTGRDVLPIGVVPLTRSSRDCGSARRNGPR